MMGIIFAVLLGLACIIGTVMFMGNVAPEIVSGVLEILSSFMSQVLYWLVLLSPFLLCILIIAVLKDRDLSVLIFGAFYGLVMAFLMWYLGLYDFIISQFQASWFYASIWDALSAVGYQAAYYTVAIFYYITGAALNVIDRWITPWLQKAHRKARRWVEKMKPRKARRWKRARRARRR